MLTSWRKPVYTNPSTPQNTYQVTTNVSHQVSAAAEVVVQTTENDMVLDEVHSDSQSTFQGEAEAKLKQQMLMKERYAQQVALYKRQMRQSEAGCTFHECFGNE